MGAFLGGSAIAEAGVTSASFPTKPGPDFQPIYLEVFGGKAIQLPNISIPLLKDGDQPGLLDIGGSVGALNSYSKAADGRANAAAGAVSSDGSVTPTNPQDPSSNGNAKIDLRVLLDQLKIDVAHQLVSAAEVDANSLSTSIKVTEGGTPETSYDFADAHARLQVPPVGTIIGGVTGGLGPVKDTVTAALGSNGAITTALQTAVNAINLDLGVAKLKTTGSTVTFSGIDDAFNALTASLPTTIKSKNGAVTLDLNTGLADVDIAKLYKGADATDLNGLPPNTDILDSKMVQD